MSSHSSKVRYDDEEYSSDDDKQGMGRYQDLLDSAQEMGSQLKASLRRFVERHGKRQNQKVTQVQRMNLRIY